MECCSVSLIDFNDAPIQAPGQDRFGVDPLASAIARSIISLKKPIGTVFAITGPWGSGKSSAINLVLHHVAALDKSETPLKVIHFACWWFRGEDALTLAFLQELTGALDRSLSEKAKAELAKITRRVLGTKEVIGAVIAATLGSPAGGIAKGVSDFADGLVSAEEPIQTRQSRLEDHLKDSNQKFLVVIDDLDRLAPDEMLQVLRLVKSVGRLPNVMYLLAFDRDIAERIASEKHPSEGPQYLEKIVQAAFELPPPSRDDLNNSLLGQIYQLCGSPDEQRIVRFMNVFYDCIAPFSNTPRDVARIMNTISVTWPAVQNDVNVADFIALETLRVVHGGVYRRIQHSKDVLAGASSRSASEGERSRAADRANALLAGLNTREAEAVRTFLRRLFPRTDSIWGGMSYGSDWDGQWQKERLACSTVYFDSYFTFSIAHDGLPGTARDELLALTSQSEKMREYLLSGLRVPRKNGGTRAALLLDELNLHAHDIREDHIDLVIKAIYSIADELDVKLDQERGFLAMASNELRIHWLTNRLTERIPLKHRSRLMVDALRSSPLHWQVSMAYRCQGEHKPEKGDPRREEQDRLTTASDAVKIEKRALSEVGRAAKDGRLLKHRRFPFLLFFWHNHTKKGKGSAAARWFKSHMRTPKAVLRIAEAFLQESWSHSMSDRVSKRNTDVGLDSIATFVSLSTFKKALEAAVGSREVTDAERDVGARFLQIWEQREKLRAGKGTAPILDDTTP